MELVIEGIPSKSFVLDWPEELDDEKRARLQAVLDAQAVYTLGFYEESTIVNTEGNIGKQEVLRKLKAMLKKARRAGGQAGEPLDPDCSTGPPLSHE